MSNYKIGSDRFNEYYKKIFANVMPTEEEFGTFLQTLYDKLPVTFRLNSGEASFQAVSEILKDANFVKQFLESEKSKQGEDVQAPIEESKETSGAAVNMDQT